MTEGNVTMITVSASQVERAEVDAAFAAWRAVLKNWDRFVDCFTDDCTWCNSLLPEPVVGREGLRAFTSLSCGPRRWRTRRFGADRGVTAGPPRGIRMANSSGSSELSGV
jgi:hypothetical protein